MERIKVNLIKKIIFPLLIISSFFISSCKDPFEKDFIEVTGENLPNGAKFIFKEESSTDFHDDFGSISQIKVKNAFYKKLSNMLLQKGFVQDSAGPRLTEFIKASSHLNIRMINYNYKFEDRGFYYYVGFLSDKESIIVVHSSW